MIRRAPLLLLLAFGFSTNRAAADFYTYLALGDSSAFGETTLRTPSNGDRGYVAPLADYLATRNGSIRPNVVNLAVNGETTTSYYTGLIADRASTDGITLNTNYQSFAPNYPSQQTLFHQVVATEAAANREIRVVTVQFGANDLYLAATTPGFFTLPGDQQAALVQQAITTIYGNYIGILTDVRTLLPNARVFVAGYHNPYNGAPDGHPIKPLADPAVRGLNSVLAQLAPSFDAQYVDIYGAIAGHEAEWTYINSGDPINDVHLTPEGYQAASGAVIGVVSAPAPPAAILGLAGIVVVSCGRRWRRAAA